MTTLPISGASLALQQALYQHVSSDAELMAMVTAVVDAAPDDQALPFIQLGADFVTDASTKTYFASDHRVTLDVWTGPAGRAQAKNIVEALRARLSTLPGVRGFAMPVWRFGLAQVIADRAGYHGIVEFRAQLVAQV